MNFNEFGVEDFLADESFQRYCLGTNEKDVLFWQSWMAANPAKYDTIRKAKELYILLNGNNSAAAFSKDAQSFRTAFEAHLEGQKQLPEEEIVYKRSSRRKVFLYAGAIAASVALIIVVFRKSNTAPPVYNTPLKYEAVQVSKAGERKSFQLPDGSKVMLNAGSTISIAESFNNATREIVLQGEAYFDVVHNAEKPFIIHTSSMDVKVLGTVFNVKAYPNDKITETSLIKGSVEVTLNNGGRKKVILRPNEKIIFPNVQSKVPASETNKEQTPAAGTSDKYKIAALTYTPVDSSLVEVSWTENRIVFNDNSFEEIATELERWYSVSIRFDDEAVMNYRYTAVFDRKNISQVLQALKLSRPFEYKIESDNKIVIGK